jgi:type VI protein secretion system component VasF
MGLFLAVGWIEEGSFRMPSEMQIATAAFWTFVGGFIAVFLVLWIWVAIKGLHIQNKTNDRIDNLENRIKSIEDKIKTKEDSRE